MIKEIYKYQFPVFKIEAIITVFTIFVALVLANAIWETTVRCGTFKGHCLKDRMLSRNERLKRTRN